MTSVNTKKGAVDFKEEEEEKEEGEDFDLSSYQERSSLQQDGKSVEMVVPDEDPDMAIYFTNP